VWKGTPFTFTITLAWLIIKSLIYNYCFLPVSPTVISDNADTANSRVKIKYEFHCNKEAQKVFKVKRESNY